MRRERDNKSCQENPETNIWGLRRGKGGLGSGKDIDEVKRGRIIFQMNFFFVDKNIMEKAIQEHGRKTITCNRQINILLIEISPTPHNSRQVVC